MEQEIKGYLEQLLKKENMPVEQRHAALLDGFVKDTEVSAVFTIIKNAQKAMADKWRGLSAAEDIKAALPALPNGAAGKPYSFAFDFSGPSFAAMGDYTVIVDESTGLAFNKDTNSITGIPAQAGDYTARFRFRLKNAAADKEHEEKPMPLTINADPKSLWKDLPSDKEDEYWRPDMQSAHAAFCGRKLVIGSMRGRSHAHEGRFRDDAFGYKYDDGTGWGIIAVADGAGSAKYSRRGAEIACGYVTDIFARMEAERQQELESTVVAYMQSPAEEAQKKLSALFVGELGKAAFGAQAHIKEEAAARGADIKDYSTTLIMALIKKYDTGCIIASFWVGDGGIGIYKETEKEVIMLGTPDSGEFAGQTRFLTMPEIFAGNAYIQRIRIKVVTDFTVLALMTDGITDPKFQTDNNLARVEKWDELWQDLQGKNDDACSVDFSGPPETAEQQLIAWLGFWSPGNHDDRTIAILY